MIIKEINCNTNFKSATITLYYDELRDISNGLSELSKLDEKRSPEFYKIRRDMLLLFSLVKNGCLDSWTIKRLSDITEKINKEQKQDD